MNLLRLYCPLRETPGLCHGALLHDIGDTIGTYNHPDIGAAIIKPFVTEEEHWICAAKPIKPNSRPLGLAMQPLELAARPADDIEIDPLQGLTQLRPIEVAVVVDPASNVRVVRLGQILQGFVTVMMKSPSPDRTANERQRLRTSCGHEAMRGDMPLPYRLPCSEHESEKVERLVREIATPVRILAIDDLRLLRVQHQLAGRKTIGKRAP